MSRRDRARAELESIFIDREVLGTPVDVRRGHVVEWAPPLNPGWFGIPDGNRKYVVRPASMPPGDFLRAQAEAGGHDMALFERGAYAPTVKRARESVELGLRDIPTPVLEIDHKGELVQEGRSRALGARRAGAPLMPLWLAKRVYR